MNTSNNEMTLEQIQNFEGKYPKQLWYLFFSEMWERFCFYGMRGMLVIFMVDKVVGLGMNDDVANLQYGATQAFVYAFTFIGGLFADKILGFHKSLFWGGLLMIIGSCILAFNPHQFFFIGIGFSIVGTGFFKPNISSMVGALYKADDKRTDAGFSLFYAGINLGALIGGYACVVIAKNYSWNLAFGLAAIVMTISLGVFIFTRRMMGPIGRSPLPASEKKKNWWYEYAVYLGSLCVIPITAIMVAKTEYTDMFMYTIGPCAIAYLLFEMRKYSKDVNKKLLAAFIFIVFSVLFWAFFEQSGGSLSLFAANHLNDTVLGLKLDPNGVNNSSNSFFVIVFASLLGMLWVWMGKRNIEPNTVVKFGLGFLFLAAGFFLFYFTKHFADQKGVTSLSLFTLGWFVITFGELSLSPIGMSIMTKLSPAPLQGVMMGMWFLASAYGQYVAGILGAGMATTDPNASPTDKLMAYTSGYKQLALYALVAGIILIAISPLVRRLMRDIR